MPFRQTRLKAHEKHQHSLGAVSFYKPEYCDQVIQCMAEGYSLTAFAGSIGVDKASIYRWITAHPEFSLAVDQARAARLKAWETKLMNADKGAQAATSIFALKNCDPEEFREVRYASFEHQVNVKQLTDEQLLAIASGQRPAEAGAIDVSYNRLLERPKPYRPPDPNKTKGAR
jgi:hypothetical protein